MKRIPIKSLILLLTCTIFFQASCKKLSERILAPSSATFCSGSAGQAAPQNQNLGVKRLFVKTPATTGNVTIIVLFSPQWSGI